MRASRPALIAFVFLIAAARAPAAAAVLITIDKSAQQMTVEVDGGLRWTWPVSTGQLGYDTPNGRYTAFRMEADHFSKEWDDAPMPHSIFFTPKGHAIHGYLNTRNIGSPASHGCVRLEPDNATKLYALVEQQGLPNTKVVVTGDVRVALAQRGRPRYRGSDDSTVADAPLDTGRYGYAPRYDGRQAAFGYRPAPSPYYPASPGYYPNYAPRSPSPYWGYSSRPFGD